MHEVRTDIVKRNRDKFTVTDGEFKTSFSGSNRTNRQKKQKQKKNQQTSRYVEDLNRTINELELISVLEDYTLKLKNIHSFQVLMKTR